MSVPTRISRRSGAAAAGYDAFDVLVVPFPFTDRGAGKRRPAVVLTHRAANVQTGHSVCAMITSADNAPWPHDIRLTDLPAAGLPSPSVIRLKWFTIDNRLILRRAGALALRDRRSLTRLVRGVLGHS
jgi:mRNA interferase MazF